MSNEKPHHPAMSTGEVTLRAADKPTTIADALVNFDESVNLHLQRLLNRIRNDTPVPVSVEQRPYIGDLSALLRNGDSYIADSCQRIHALIDELERELF